jgi:Protein of unknown function (DUF2764)
LSKAEALLEWQYQSLTHTDISVCSEYHETMQAISNPCLQRFVQFRLNLRTVMSLLRMQINKQNLNEQDKQHMANEKLGSSMRRLLAHFDDAEKLIYLFPWLKTASTYLQQHRAVDLERLLMQLVWRYADMIKEQYLFLFESVFAYVFQWDIVSRWLSYEAAPAQQRFTELEREITDGYC